jgi:FkbM family methyltransferase
MPYCRWEVDRYVIEEVLQKRAYARLELGPGDTLLDLGAHVGSCVRFALDAGVDRVAAVEMLPDTFRLLVSNFPPERYEPRVVCLPYAVTGGSDPLVTTRYFRNPMSASVSRHNSADREGVQVPTVALPTLLDTFSPTKLKFDIENSEYDTLLPCMAQLTASPVTRVWGELHTRTAETLDLAKQLWRAFDSDGWEASRHVDGFYQEPNGWNIVMGWWR